MYSSQKKHNVIENRNITRVIPTKTQTTFSLSKRLKRCPKCNDSFAP